MAGITSVLNHSTSEGIGPAPKRRQVPDQRSPGPTHSTPRCLKRR